MSTTRVDDGRTRGTVFASRGAVASIRGASNSTFPVSQPKYIVTPNEVAAAVRRPSFIRLVTSGSGRIAKTFAVCVLI